jgi:N-methylhydantoinase A
MDTLNLPRTLVPPNPGNVSAFGLLTVDVKNDYVQTHVAKESVLDHAAVQGILDDLTDRARQALDKEGFAAEEHRFQRTIDVRYVGQAFEVRVAAPEGTVDSAYVEQVADTFHTEHRQLYGYDFRGDRDQQVEWVNLRVTGIGPITRPEIQTLGKVSTPLDQRQGGRATSRPVCFDAEQGYIDTPVIWRADLGAGDTFSGPAIVEEFGSTIPVHPGFVVEVDDWANLVIRKSSNQETAR